MTPLDEAKRRELVEPCPLCGEEAVLRERYVDDNDRAPRPHRVYSVDCEACELHIERMSRQWWSGLEPPPVNEDDAKAKAEVIDAWNHRTALALAPEPAGVELNGGTIEQWHEAATQHIEELQAICEEFGVLGGENRLTGIRRVLTEQRASLAGAGAGTVPEGWRAVPIEPTDAMVEAGLKYRAGVAGMNVPDGYQAMLAAAPKPPAAPQPTEPVAEVTDEMVAAGRKAFESYKPLSLSRAIRSAIVAALAASPPVPSVPEPAPQPLAEPFGLTTEDVAALLAAGLKPEEIGGAQKPQAERVRELLHWFVRFLRGSANPKWFRPHAFELAYYIATTDDRAPFDLHKVKQAAWLTGLAAPQSERDMAIRHGWIETPATPPSESSGLDRATVEACAKWHEHRAAWHLSQAAIAEAGDLDRAARAHRLQEGLHYSHAASLRSLAAPEKS